MSEKKCTRLKTNILRQDCYVRECFGAEDLRSHVPAMSSYPLIEQVVEQGGVREVVTERPYPITPESVNSYADSCDYKLDPEGCQLSGRKNLGDIRVAQDLLSMDSGKLREEHEALRLRMLKIQEALGSREPKTTAPAPAPADNTEVK